MVRAFTRTPPSLGGKMGVSGNWTLFQNDAGTPTGGIDYVKDVFKDVSLPASSNSGFSTSTLKNPFSGFYGNDDAPKFGPKTLWVKGIELIDDKTKWVRGLPLYKIIWNENFPGVDGYFEGVGHYKESNQTSYIESLANDSSTTQPRIYIVTTAIQCSFVCYPNTSSTALFSKWIDGTSAGQIIPEPSIDVFAKNTVVYDLGRKHCVGPLPGDANVSKDIHTYVAQANGRDRFQFEGVIVSWAATNIDCYPGTTYVNKDKATTTSGSTFAVPAMGSSLGGRTVVYKTSGGTYGATISAAPMTQTIGVGASGTNQITVTTGTGSSFFAGCGLVAIGTGASQVYVGSVLSQSTDTLTVGPTLSFGVSGLLYRAWTGHSLPVSASFYTNGTYSTAASFPISASFYTTKATFGFTEILGFSNIYPGVTTATPLKYFSDPNGNYAVWGNNIGVTNLNYMTPCLGMTLSANSFLQVDGRFSAVEFEFASGSSNGTGLGNLIGSFSINGCAGFTMSLSFTTDAPNSIRIPVMYDSGPGWNSVVFTPGISFGNYGIKTITMYDRNDAVTGVSYGKLAYLDTLQTHTGRTAINATLMALGTWKRYYAEELFFKQTSWGRGTTFTVPGTVAYYGTSTNAQCWFRYYGKNFAVVGSAGGGSITATVDGGAATVNFNTVTNVATEGWHDLVISVAGATPQIHAIDVCRTYDEVKNVQNFVPTASGNSFVTFGEIEFVNHTQQGNSAQILFFSTQNKNDGPFLAESNSNTGTAITVLKDGFYQVYTHVESSAANDFALTKNQSDLGSGPRTSAPEGELVALSTVWAANGQTGLSRITRLKAGDTIRVGVANTFGTGGQSAKSKFGLAYLGKLFFGG